MRLIIHCFDGRATSCFINYETWTETCQSSIMCIPLIGMELTRERRAHNNHKLLVTQGACRLAITFYLSNIWRHPLFLRRPIRHKKIAGETQFFRSRLSVFNFRDSPFRPSAVIFMSNLYTFIPPAGVDPSCIAFPRNLQIYHCLAVVDWYDDRQDKIEGAPELCMLQYCRS